MGEGVYAVVCEAANCRAQDVMVCSHCYDAEVNWLLTLGSACIAGELFARKPLFKGRNDIQ